MSVSSICMPGIIQQLFHSLVYQGVNYPFYSFHRITMEGVKRNLYPWVNEDGSSVWQKKTGVIVISLSKQTVGRTSDLLGAVHDVRLKFSVLAV